MNDARVRQIMKDLGYEHSLSHYQAFKQFENEIRMELAERLNGFDVCYGALVCIAERQFESMSEVEAYAQGVTDQVGGDVVAEEVQRTARSPSTEGR